ncbi:MAG: hypothetical protein E7556_07210, partial [Ruminococcaceae bacterium]|nr:hypothetical protein [Oscillospiraceae bacterium]
MLKLKRFLSLFLALVVAVGICISAPMTIEAEAATQVDIILAHAQNIADNDPHAYDGYCLAFCGACYKAAGYAHYSMGDAYNAGSAWIISTSSTNIPVGALVFYGKEWSDPYGHVGIYAGNGKMYDARSASGGVKLRAFSTSDYRGWGWYGGIAPVGIPDPAETPTVKLSKTSLAYGETATVTWNSCARATRYWLSCWKEGEGGYQRLTYAVSGFSKTINTSDDILEPGNYSITICSYDQYNRESVGNWVKFTVLPKNYTVSYNANGGSNPPSSQTKTHGTNLTLSTTKPTKTGYTFKGWGTSASDTTVDYAPGSTYSANANITLYAIWSPNAYTVSYDANGGSGAPSSQTKYHDQNLTLSTTKPTRTGYNFMGWGTSTGDTSVNYEPGATYSSNANITLYAIWEKKTYTVTYRSGKDGTTNLPADQTKVYGQDLVLSTQIPTCPGYTFLYWHANFGSRSDYKPGDVYKEENVNMLVAQWKCNHTLNGTTIVNAKDPTYTEEGYTGDTKCNTCEEIIKTGTSVSKLTLGVPQVKTANATNGINVSWNSVNGAQSYIVYRKTYNTSTAKWGGWETLTTDCTATSYVDTKALLGVKYIYTTVAVAGDVKSSFVATSALLRDVAPTVKISNANAGINVTWNSVYGAQKYTVY